MLLKCAAWDLLQASEKFWRAAAQTLKSVAQEREWEHDSHAHFFRIVRRLIDESGDNELFALFTAANSLHGNFYENWMNEAEIRTQSEQVRRRIERVAAIEPS